MGVKHYQVALSSDIAHNFMQQNKFAVHVLFACFHFWRRLYRWVCKTIFYDRGPRIGKVRKVAVKYTTGQTIFS